MECVKPRGPRVKLPARGRSPQGAMHGRTARAQIAAGVTTRPLHDGATFMALKVAASLLELARLVNVMDGGHAVITGDCRRLIFELPPASVDVVVTDPPYGDTSLEWDVPIYDWLSMVSSVLKPSGSVWIFGSMRSFLAGGVWSQGWKLAQDIVWEKHNGSSFHADRFKRVHEHAIQLYLGEWADVYKDVQTTPDATARAVRRKERPPHTGEIADSTYVSHDGGPRLQRSVLRVRSTHGYAEHPTQKPIGILEPLIAYSCPPGGLVLDPFAGSGSTLVAAKNLGRRAVGFEVEPKYVDVARRRLAQEVLPLTELERTAQASA